VGVSLRSVIIAGVSSVAAGSIALTPALQSPPRHQAAAHLPVVLTAEVAPLPRVVIPGPATASVQPAAFVEDTGTPATAEVGTASAASNVIDSVYAVTRYWANYVALELGPWAIGWLPFGYLINDQIYIWYPSFVLPVVDSYVYQFLDPVVSDPLNLAVWANGIGAVVNTAVNGFVSSVQQEITYLISLQWLPFPIPPLPFATTAATEDTIADPSARLLSATTAVTVDDGTLVTATEDTAPGQTPVQTSEVPLPPGSDASTAADVAEDLAGGDATAAPGGEPAAEGVGAGDASDPGTDAVSGDDGTGVHIVDDEEDAPDASEDTTEDSAGADDDSTSTTDNAGDDNPDDTAKPSSTEPSAGTATGGGADSDSGSGAASGSSATSGSGGTADAG